MAEMICPLCRDAIKGAFIAVSGIPYHRACCEIEALRERVQHLELAIIAAPANATESET